MHDRVIKNWLALAEYDLETARALMQVKRYFYVVFACQQAIEKMLKAIYVKKSDKTPPYIHNLVKLLEDIGLLSSITKLHREFIEDLCFYYRESRYSESFEYLDRELTQEVTEDILFKTEEFIQWLKSKL